MNKDKASSAGQVTGLVAIGAFIAYLLPLDETGKVLAEGAIIACLTWGKAITESLLEKKEES